jgi:hypothetical protein
MHTDDLVAIRDALTAIIALPAPIREVVASLAPARVSGSPNAPTLVTPEAHRRVETTTPEEVRASEGRLLDVMRAAPNAGVAELARHVGSNTSTVSMRLGRLAERGEVECIDGNGGLSRKTLRSPRWRRRGPERRRAP